MANTIKAADIDHPRYSRKSLSVHFREVVAQKPRQWPDPLKDYPFIVLNKKPQTRFF